MTKLKDIDFKILFELMKNSKISDRKLAKTLGVSQPTVSRRRARLEKELIAGYTVIPKWNRVGFKIVVFTFIKSKFTYSNPKEREAAIQKAREWMMKHPNVIWSIAGEGMGWDGLTVSLHKSYSDYMKFKRKHDSELGDIVDDTQTFITDIDPGFIVKPFHFKYLADSE